MAWFVSFNLLTVLRLRTCYNMSKSIHLKSKCFALCLTKKVGHLELSPRPFPLSTPWLFVGWGHLTHTVTSTILPKHLFWPKYHWGSDLLLCLRAAGSPHLRVLKGTTNLLSYTQFLTRLPHPFWIEASTLIDYFSPLNLSLTLHPHCQTRFRPL